MFQRWLRRNRPAPARRVAPLAEWLEPRLLFSADLSAGWLSAPVAPQDQEVRTLSAQGEYARAAQPQSLAEAWVTTALNFEKNVGQARAGIDYIASGSGYTIALSDGGADILLAGAKAPVHLEIVGGRDDVKAKGEGLLDARSNYLLGNDRSKWLTDIANHRAVLYQDVYRGVDVRYYGTQRQLEYDFIVAAGADASQIRLRFDGAEARLDAEGNLLLHTPEGRAITFDAPVSYQQGPNGREAVASSYRLHADGSVSIRLGAYDKSRELVIDPVLSYASYFGENNTETGVDIAVDAAGKVYVTGTTNSTSGVLGTLLGGLFGTNTVDTYVAKFNADLSALEWSARVGGNGEDTPTAIAVDAAGSAVVTGWTKSSDFATPGAADTSRGGTQDAFVYRLNAAGTSLVFATYYGDANNGESGNGIALDADGDIYVGGTASGASGGGTDAFVARYGSTGALQLQFKYGGGNDEVGNDIAVDAAGHIYIVGTSKGGTPAMLGGHQTGRVGGDEGFLARFDASGTLVYGTFIGGDEDDTAVALAVGANGRAYVVGQTEKSDDSGFQLTTGAWNTSRVDPWTGYLRIYDTSRTGAASLLYSTLVGGTGPDSAPVGVGLRGDVVIVVTDKASPGMAVTTDALKATHSPGTAHIAAINPGGAGAGDLVWGSYYGNGLTAGGVAVNGPSIYVAGSTGANGLATPGAADTTRSGQDAIVGRITLANDPPVLSGFNAPTMLEDLPGNGFTVLSLVTGKLADTNAGAVLGIAITGATSAGGTWHYSLNGGSDWIALGTPAPGAALLLAADSLTRLRFTPSPNYNGTGATLTFRGWDRTAGLEGSTADATTGGGSSAFSVAEVTAPLAVVAVNDEPRRTAGTVASLDVAEGAPATSLGLGGLAYDGGGDGTEAGQLLTFTVTGVPGGSFGRIVLADGTTTVTAGTTYTLLQLQGMQFVGGTATSGSRGFSFSVVDNGGTANGGDNTLVETLTITITNQAPVLAGSNPLPAIAEDVPSAGNNGMRVADLVAGRISDPLGIHGIAVVGAGSANGTWQYRRTDAAAWTAFGSVGAGNAVLLLADADDRIRFLPNANWNGTDTGLLFRAWDGSGGTAGNLTGNTGLAGGSSPYSAATATASITVTPVNDAPVAAPVTANGVEDTGPVTLVLGGSDIDGTIAGITLGALPAAQGKLYTDASLLVEATPGTYAGSALTLYFVPAADFSGNASFTYTVTDNEGLSDNTPATVTIAVAPVNDAPVANDVAASGAEDGGAIAIVLSGTDVDGTVTHATFTTLPTAAQGRLYIDAARTTLAVAGTSYGIGTATVYFVPAADYNGTVQFSYTVRDNLGAGDATPGTVTVTVTPVNDAPVASGATASGNEDAAAIPVTLGGTDVDGTVQAVTLVTLPPLGQGKLYTDAALTVEAVPGTYAGSSLTLYFVPARDFNGDASFGYTVVDDAGAVDASPATATVSVAPVNDAPVATPVAVVGAEDAASITIRLEASDVDSAIQGYVLGALPANGLLYTNAARTTLASAGTLYTGATVTLYFVPAPNFNGAANFTFTAVDASGLASAPATAAITVTPVNDAPVATGATASGTEDGAPVAITLGGTDIDGAVAGIQLQTLPTVGQGTLYVDAAGTIEATLGTIYAGSALTLYFVPAHDFNGDATFSYKVKDDLGLASASATATVTIAAVNDAPVARPASATGNEDAAAIAIKLEADDVDSAIQGYMLGSLPANGLLYTDAALTTLATESTLYAGTAVTLYFVPGANFNGAPSFTFTAVDASGLASAPQSATVTVTAVNDAPVASGATAAGTEDGQAIPITLGGTDIDGSVAGVTLVSLPPALQGKLYTDATLLVEAALNTTYVGSALTLYFVPAHDFNGNATFSYAVKDDLGLANAPATATVTVAAVNDAPVARPAAATGAEDAASIAIKLEASDVDSVIQGYVLGSLPANGLLYTDAALTTLATESTLYAGTAVTLYFVPSPNFNGAPGFTFTAVDASGLASAAETATITVTPVNDAPAAAGATASGTEDGAPVAITLGGTDIDGTVAGITLQTLPTAGQGRLYLDAAGTIAAALGTTYAGSSLTLYFVPAHDFNGDASFSYTVKDDLGLASAPATATVTLAAVNDAPVARPAFATGDEDAAAIAIKLEADDVDSAIQGYVLGSLPANGVLYTDVALTTLATANTLYLGTAFKLYFVPDRNFNGAPTFTFTAVDASGLASDLQTATITVRSVNDAPEAVDVTKSIVEDGSAVAITLGGSDVDGTVAGFTLATLPPALQGKLYMDAAGTIAATLGTSYAGSTLTLYFVPAADFAGDATFKYLAVDAEGLASASPATATITVTPVNDAPVLVSGTTGNLAVPDGTAPASLGLEHVVYSVGGGADEQATQRLTFTITALPSSLGDVLLADGTTLVLNGGTYTLAELQGMKFRAAAAVGSGPATFSFTVSDDGGTAGGGANTLAQSLQVTVVNRAPELTGVNPLPAMAEDAAPGNGMLVRDLVDGRISDPQNTFGIAVIAASHPAGTWEYSRDGGATWRGFAGVADDDAVLLEANGQNRIRFVADANWNGTAGGLVFRGWDQTGGTAGSTRGDTTHSGNATPYSDATAEATVVVTPVNDAPVAAAANAAGNEDAAAIAITLTATDIDNAIRGYTLGSLPANGLLYTDAALTTLAGTGTLYLGTMVTLYFVPAAEFSGTLAFTFSATDVAGAISAPQAATIAVAAVNDAPVARPATATGNEDAASIAITLAANDVDNAILGYTLASLPANGLLYTDAALTTLAATGTLYAGTTLTLYFVPAANFNGTPTFTFTATDVAGATSAPQTATITVTAVNDAPLQVGGVVAGVTVVEGGNASLGLRELAFAAGGGGYETTQALTYTVTAVPAAGLGTVLLADGSTVIAGASYTLEQLRGMRFAAAPGVTAGSGTFSFAVRDGGGTDNGGVDLLQRSLAVTVRNQAPVLTGANDLPAVLEDARANAGMLVADLVAERIADPSHVFGIAVVAANGSAGAWEYSVDGGGTWTSLAGSSESAARLLAADSLTRVRFVPAPDWNGTASGLSFRAWDRSDGLAAGDTARAATGGGATAFSATLATARIVVRPVNDAPIAPAAPVVVGTAGQDRIPLGLGSLPYSAGAPDDERTQSLGLVITALPPAGAGTLALADGTPVKAGTAYSLEEARGMQFVPAAGTGGGEVRIAYLLQDDGGTDGGGVDRVPGVLQLRITPAAPGADPSLLPAPPATGGGPPAPAPAPAPSGGASPAPAPSPAPAGVRPAPQASTGDALVESPAASTLLPAGSDMSFAVERRVIPLESVRPAIGIAERAALQFVGFAGTGADFQVMGFNDLGAGGTRLTLEQLQQTLRSEAFLEQMDRLRDNLRQEFDLDKTVSISVAGVSLGLSVAYVLWLVRGGVLVGSYLSALPAWRLLDPLPVLARAGEEEEDEEDEPLDARASARPADPLRGFA